MLKVDAEPVEKPGSQDQGHQRCSPGNECWVRKVTQLVRNGFGLVGYGRFLWVTHPQPLARLAMLAKFHKTAQSQECHTQ